MSLPCRVQLTALVITIAVPFSFRILSGAATQTAALSSPVSIPDDPTADRFVEGLMSRMTLSEKLGQMTQIAVNGPSDGVSFEDHIRKGEVGSFQSTTDPERISHLQHIAVEQSRLHIPLSFAFDVIHGFRTVYPIPLALAGSCHPALVEHTQEMGEQSSRLGHGDQLDVRTDA